MTPLEDDEVGAEAVEEPAVVACQYSTSVLAKVRDFRLDSLVNIYWA